MAAPIEFATNTELAAGLRMLIEELEKRAGLREPIFDIGPGEIAKRADEALAGCVGNADYLRMNLREVLQTATRLEATRQ